MKYKFILTVELEEKQADRFYEDMQGAVMEVCIEHGVEPVNGFEVQRSEKTKDENL